MGLAIFKRFEYGYNKKFLHMEMQKNQRTFLLFLSWESANEGDIY